MRTKRALIISPFATAPLDAGQRLRAYQSTKMFAEQGYSISFLLYAFENPWYWRSQPDYLEAMRQQWGDVRIVHSKRQVSEPPKDGDIHALDEWWDDELGVTLKNIFSYEEFDICVVHNVWLSKAFDFVPARTVKVIDTHDVFSTRREIFQANGIPPEFFLIDWDGERFGLERGEIILTIKPEEAQVLRDHGLARTVVNLPYVSPASEGGNTSLSYGSEAKVRFGFLGTSHSFNRAGMEALLRQLDSEVKRTLAPVEVVIAGNIGSALDIGDIDYRPVRLGYVDSEAEFYNGVDIAIVPVFNGTGFKVKVAELAQLRKPLLCARHAAEGITLDEAQIFDDPAQMARAMVDIAIQRPDLAIMSERAGAALDRIESDYREARDTIEAEILKRRKVEIFIVPEGRAPAVQLAQILSHILHARVMSHSHSSIIVLPENHGLDLETMNRVSVSGLEFVTAGALARNRDTLRASNLRVFVSRRSGWEDEIEALDLDPSQIVVDLRFSELAEIDTADIARMRHAAGLLVNHRQGRDINLIPLQQRQDYFCAPVLAWEATWDPNIRQVLNRIAKLGKVRDCRSMIVCAGPAIARALQALVTASDREGVAIFDVDDADQLNDALATLLERVFTRRQPLDYVVATSRASWLHALADHGAKISGDVTTRPLAKFWNGDEMAGQRPITAAVATGQVFRVMGRRLERLAETGSP